jgi:hypothetical protein
VLPIFDAPVVACQFQQWLRTGFLGPTGSHGKGDIVGFFDHLAFTHRLSVAVDAHDVSHSGKADRLGVSGDAP